MTNRNYLRASTFIACAIFFRTPAIAQSNFDGEFRFADREHVKGPEYVNGVPSSITIEVTKDSVIIYSGEMQNDKEEKTRVAFANTDQPYLYRGKASGRKYMRSVKWSDDKKSFTTTNEFYKEGSDDEIQLTRIDEYKISDDGKQLLFNRRSVETITESWEDKATYNRN